MNAPIRTGDLLTAEEVIGQFFAPATTDMVDALVGQYQQAREHIKQVAAFANGELCSGVLGYFLEGNATEDRGRTSLSTSAAQLFQEDGAVAQLNAAYWSKALALTDVYDAMPQGRRSQWNEQIRNPKGVKNNRGDSEWQTPPLPDFEEETVRATLQGLLHSRAQFLAERVDGIFRALSGEHVTNSPAAFGKRMIIANLITSYGTVAYERVGYINVDRIVMNPPYSAGRWQAHVEHASTMLAPAGRLVAILPASAKGKELLPGWAHEWSQVFENQFAGTSVDVVILVAERQ